MSSIQPANGAYTIPNLYVNGLQISRGSNTTLSIAAGQCNDSNGIVDLVLGNSPLNGLTTSAPFTLNAAINGAGGLDTGTLANSTMYAIFVIGDSTYNNPVSVILTLGTNALPKLPFGYDSYRRIGFWATDGSAHFRLGWYAGNGSGRFFLYDGAMTVLSMGIATSYTAIDLSSVVPQVDKIIVKIRVQFGPAGAGHVAYLQPFGGTGDEITVVAPVVGTNEIQDVFVMSRLNAAAPTVNYKVTDVADVAEIYITGFIYYI